MLFPRNTLASGPQACFAAEKKIAKVKMGKGTSPFDIESIGE
jgi:hypothetical protein